MEGHPGAFFFVQNLLPENWKWICKGETAPNTVAVIVLLAIISYISKRKLSLWNPSRFQMFIEFAVSTLDNYIKSIVGSESKTLTPIIGTLFIYIFSLNLFGLVPGMKSPTADIHTTIALALFAFFLVQYYAISRNGIVNYIKHFLGEPLWLAPLMLPLHIIGELARPLSLSMRLFGNIFGEDMVIIVLITIVISTMGNFMVPIQAGMMLFAIFTSFVQALVFSTLVGIYISVSLEGHSEHGMHSTH